VLDAWLLGALAFGLTNYRLIALRIAAYYTYFVAAIGVAVVFTQIYPSL
jgi:ABC-type Co2+ transport system permease subunit